LSFNPIALFSTPKNVMLSEVAEGLGAGMPAGFVAEADISGTSRPSRDRPFGRYRLS